MAGFRKAKAQQAAVKMAMYGPAGSGKTLTSLLVAEGLAAMEGKRIAYIDTEHGTDFYCMAVPQREVHPGAFDFDALYTRSLTETLTEVRRLNPAEYSVVIVDSITHLWEAARNSYNGKVGPDGQIPMHAWGKIKKPYKELITYLLSSPMHFIICGRQGNEFSEDENGKVTHLGVKMKAEGETAYEPHILIRMEMEKGKDGHGRVVAFAEKDRTGILSGKPIFNPTFETLVVPMLNLLGGTQAQVVSEEETTAQDVEALEEQERQREEGGARHLKKFAALINLAENTDELKEIGKKITPDLKRQMTTAQVNELRAAYQQAEKELAAGGGVQRIDTSTSNMPGAVAPPPGVEVQVAQPGVDAPAAGNAGTATPAPAPDPVKPKAEPRVDTSESQVSGPQEAYQDFHESVMALASSKGGNSTEIKNAIKRQLIAVGKVGKGHETTQEWRQRLIDDIENARGNFLFLARQPATA